MRAHRLHPLSYLLGLLTILGTSAMLGAQQPAAPSPAEAQPAAQAPPAQPPLTLSSAEQGQGAAPAVTEDELRQQLQGKTFYLRSGYLENNLRFDQQGHLDGNSPQASHTLSLVEIQRVKLEKRRLILEGARYGLHFLGASPTEDQTAAVDKVRLTTKKKPLQISISREEVVKAKKPKEKKEKPSKHGPQTPAINPPVNPPADAAAARPPPEPETRHGQPVTTSAAEANRNLAVALDRVLAAGMDDRMIATLPDYWKLFYKSVAEHRDFRPADPAILRQSQTDQKAKLLSVVEPPSNEYAQKNGVAGMAMYHVVIGPDGKPQQVAVARPIGFGLDENAVQAIQKAAYQPAVKEGKPVPVLLDLVVQFRIFSKRTAVASTPPPPGAPPAAAILPGPYTINALRQQPTDQPAQPPADQQAAPTADTTQQPPTEAAQQPTAQDSAAPAQQSPAPQPPPAQVTPPPQPQANGQAPQKL